MPIFIIIALGIGLLAYVAVSPFILLIIIWFLPIAAQISFILWLGGSIHGMIIAKKETVVSMMKLPFIYTIVFMIVLRIFAGDNQINPDFTIIYIFPLFSLPVLFLSGKIGRRIYQWKKQSADFLKCQEYIIAFYSVRKEGINKIREQLNIGAVLQGSETRLLRLLALCGQPDILETYSVKCNQLYSERLSAIEPLRKTYGITYDINRMTIGEIYERVLSLEAECDRELDLIRKQTINNYEEIKNKCQQLKQSVEK